MEQQCWCRPTSEHERCLRLSLLSLDTSKNYNSAEDDQWWRNAARIQTNSTFIKRNSNCTLHKPQIDQSKIFDFDPDAIQIMEDMELQQLPEAVNREILKNSQEIIFEKEEEESRKNFIKLYEENNKILRNSREIIFKVNDKNISMQNTSKRNLIIKERDENWKNNQKITFEAEENEILENLIELNKRKKEILENNQVIDFAKEEKKFLETNLIRSHKKKNDVLIKNQEIASEEQEEDILESNIMSNRLNAEKREILKRSQAIALEEEERDCLIRKILERNLIRLNMKNTSEIYEEEDLFTYSPLVKDEGDYKGIENTLQECRKRYKTKNKEVMKQDYEISLEKKLGITDQRCQIMPIIRDKKNMRYFLNEQQRFSTKLKRSFSDDGLVVNDKKIFREFRKNAINQSIIPINQDQENLKRKFFSNDEQNFSKKFSRSLIDNSLIMDDVQSFTQEPEKNAINNTINREDYKIYFEKELGIHDSFPSKEQKSLREFNKNLIHDPYMISDTKSFKEFEKHTINDVHNIRMLEEGRKCLKELRK